MLQMHLLVIPSRHSLKPYLDYVAYVYQRMDPLPEQERFEVPMVVGTGRGPLVRASLQAAEETSRKRKVYAAEKNPNVVIKLHVGYTVTVTVFSSWILILLF
ncbi:hypothetical protein Cni_G02079 [Canna indica]|uniref:PRMT5 arginine-N-methyltransferase domain-containing protein n=1 Tax=Canna indica TaxID=4628 RepID=A0AAQ3Q2D6_9LILI|nr:hypothetical protein Cni_G02079 [Canna indica]